jgi:hypothetical protein
MADRDCRQEIWEEGEMKDKDAERLSSRQAANYLILVPLRSA